MLSLTSFQTSAAIKTDFGAKLGFVVAVFVGFGPLAVQASLLPSQPVPEKISELKGRASGLISEAANRRLSRAQELAAAEDYAPAIATLSDYLNKSTNKGERSQFLQSLGFIQAQKGDYAKARKSLEEALSLSILPYGPTVSTIFALGQLSAGAEDYKGCLKIMTDFFALVETPKPEAYILTATCQAQLGAKDKALGLVELAISQSEKPAENWLLFAVGLHFEKENWAKAKTYLLRLTDQFPQKGQYWKQLAGVNVNLNLMGEALAAMEIAHKQKALERGPEFINLAALRIDKGQPFEAATLLESKIKEGVIEPNRKNWEMAADAFLMARETDRALKAMQEAAKYEGDGKLLAKQGQIYMEKEDWKRAADALAQAISLGGVSSPEQVLLGLGIAKFHLKDLSEAVKSFEKAQELKEDFRAARQWMSFVQSEIESQSIKL